MKTETPEGSRGGTEELTWPSCVKVLIQASTVVLMRAWRFWVLQNRWSDVSPQLSGQMIEDQSC